MRSLYFAILFLAIASLKAQVWPSSAWSSAVNLTATMSTDGVNDFSGLHFNPTNNRLYGVQNDGRLRVLLWNTVNNSFSQLASKLIGGGPEGITQANLFANEFYTIDENSYQIRRFSHTANFSSVTLLRSWNLLQAPSPMEDTGNTGPEGIVFIPDSFLTAIGFVSQQTGQAYTSVKGLGGLFFVAHQDEGYVWVFDVNPNADDDFAYVGKYQTGRTESCDLSFDRSTGLLYILHNIDGNKLEVTNLSTITQAGGGRKFVATSEYDIPNPTDGNDNVEGFAMTPRCPENGPGSAWLCRDVANGDDPAILQDALRWFRPFNAEGNCIPLEKVGFEKTNSITVLPNPATETISISGQFEKATVRISTMLGQQIMSVEGVSATSILNIATLEKGIYILEAYCNGSVLRTKWIKN